MDTSEIAAKAKAQDRQPGLESEMEPRPEFIKKDYKTAGKLEGKIALITGGDSGIGRAVSVHFAREGADIAIVYLDEEEDARETRRLVKAAGKNIRVNAVAPGPVWTPLIVSTFEKEKVKNFGTETAMQRPGQPSELGPAYVFLASDDASYITGQVLHVNGGEVVNG